MKILLLICAYLNFVSAISLTNELLNSWENFKTIHSKKYKFGFEDNYRFKVFKENVKIIEKHNKRHDLGLVSFRMGINKFTDLTYEEFRSTFSCFLQRNITNHHNGSTFLTPNFVKLPSEVDWRKHGYVTAVKNQESCGSCWAFSTTGSLEGQHFKKTGGLISLSEQNLVDCAQKFGNKGCNGGLMDNAFDYIQMNHGIDTENTYPYEGVDGVCRFNPQNVGATVSGHVDIPEGSESDLTKAIATVGPISVAIDATQKFQLYESGIFDDDMCSRFELNHGVLAVGYGTKNGTDYYIVKNSWGENWGDAGYVLMIRNQKNNCGIATAASYPLV